MENRSMDPRGYITKFEYDPVTEAMTRRIDGVDTAMATGVPTSWTRRRTAGSTW